LIEGFSELKLCVLFQRKANFRKIVFVMRCCWFWGNVSGKKKPECKSRLFE
jgi:hypothetical protein